MSTQKALKFKIKLDNTYSGGNYHSTPCWICTFSLFFFSVSFILMARYRISISSAADQIIISPTIYGVIEANKVSIQMHLKIFSNKKLNYVYFITIFTVLSHIFVMTFALCLSIEGHQWRDGKDNETLWDIQRRWSETAGQTWTVRFCF